MLGKRTSIAIVGALLCGLTGVAMADTAAALDTQALQAEMASMRAEIAQLRHAQNDNWLNERRAEEVKSLIREVLDDADTRASLQGDGMLAGHDGKFFLASADGKFRLNVGGAIQFRYIYNSRDNSGVDDDVFGFQYRRNYLIFSGHVADPKIGYKVKLGADRAHHNSDGDVNVEEMVLDNEITDGVVLYGGRTKAPLLREELTSATRQLAIERSLMNLTFSTAYTEGVGLKIDPMENVKLDVMLNDGFGAANYGTGADFNADATDIAVTARADILLAGDWGQMKDFTAWSGEEMALFFGAAVHYEVTESGDMQVANAANDDFVIWTVDGSLEYESWGLYGAVAGMHTDAVTGGTDLDHYGFLVQGSYNWNDELEPFVRYEHIDLDEDGGVFTHDVALLTFGANYYLRKHASKLSLDVVWALDSLDELATSDALGLLADAAGEEDQVAIRAQFQLLF